MEELKEPLDSISSRLNTVIDLIEKKNKAMEERKQIMLENAKKEALKAKVT